MTNADPIERLVAAVHHTSYGNLPDCVVNAAKKAIADTAAPPLPAILRQ